MTTREKLQASGVNLNTIVASITLLGMVATGVLFIAPLRSLPTQQENIQNDLGEMKRTQAVQTEALKTLADVARDTKETRERSIQHDTELRDVKRRLDRLEAR